MAYSFNTSPRKETPTRYDNNKEINLLIEKMFKASVKDFLENTPENIPSMIPEKDDGRIFNSPEIDSIKYGESTLGNSGCAVFTFHQGLRLSRGLKKFHIDLLAVILASKNYYEVGKGTYHNLFDHYGLRRASDIQEIFDTLQYKNNPVVTLLVRNAEYMANDLTSGRHFINVVGNTDYGFYVDDPQSPRRILLDFGEVVPAIDIAWIW